MYVDSHCHLNMERDGHGSAPEIIARAKAANVSHMLTICCEIAKEKDQVIAIAESDPDVFCTIGTHPHESGGEDEKMFTAEDIAKICTHPKVVGIGESGLDYYYMHSDKEAQITSFRKHIQACLLAGLPLIVHSRDADEDTMKVLAEEAEDKGLQGVMHCFSSTAWLAQEAVKFGFYVSFSGIVTFKKAQELRDIAADVPLDRLLMETDSPYLAPEPYRGRVNEPAYVSRVCEVLAELHGLSVEEMAKITSDNFFRLFHKAQRHE